MNYSNIEIASKLKSDMDTLRLEIEQINGLIKAERPNKSWLFKKYLKRKPTEKTYKGYWCASGIDYIESTVLINPREAQAVVNVKLQEIEELKREIELLD